MPDAAADCERDVRSGARGAYNTKMGRSRWLNRIAVAVLLVALGAAAVSAQRRRGRFFEPIRSPTPDTFQGAFNFCRMMFSQGYEGCGGNWAVDYPRADVNLSIRLSELTKTRISTDASGEPDHIVIGLTDPALFECPFVMMTEVGSAYISPKKQRSCASTCRRAASCGPTTSGARTRGSTGCRSSARCCRRTNTRSSNCRRTIRSSGSSSRSPQVPQIASINFWMGSGGGTSEQGADSAVPHAMGVADKQGRLMVLMTHNTDFGDSWEREGDDPNYFYHFSVDGYAFGINVLLYAMSH